MVARRNNAGTPTSIFDLNDVPTHPSTQAALQWNPSTLELEWVYAPQLLTDLIDVPDPTPSYYLQRNTNNTGYQWGAGISGGAFGDIFTDPIADYSCAGVATETTLIANAYAGNSYIYVSDPSSYSSGHGIVIPGGGAGGTDLVTSVTSKGSNYLNLAAPLQTNVIIAGNPVTVYHDDNAGIQAAIDDNQRYLWLRRGAKFVSHKRINMTHSGGGIFGPMCFNYQGNTGFSAGNYGWPDYNTYLGGADSHTAVILQRYTNDHGLLVSSSYCSFNGFTVGMYPGYTHDIDNDLSNMKIGSYDINELYDYSTAPSATGVVAHTRLMNMTLADGWDGLHISKHWNLKTQGINFVYSFRRNGILVNTEIPFGGAEVYNWNLIGNAISSGSKTVSADVEYAIKVINADFMRYGNIQTGRTAGGVQIDSTCGGAQIFNNCYSDDIDHSYAIHCLGSRCLFMSYGYNASNAGGYYLGGTKNKIIGMFGGPPDASYPDVLGSNEVIGYIT